MAEFISRFKSNFNDLKILICGAEKDSDKIIERLAQMRSLSSFVDH